jgi:hypothetical protein
VPINQRGPHALCSVTSTAAGSEAAPHITEAAAKTSLLPRQPGGLCGHVSVVIPDFSGKVPHLSAKRKIFLQTVKDAKRALFARIQLSQSWARYPGCPRAFFGEPHVDVT